MVLGTIYFICGEVEKHLSIFLHPNKLQIWALQEKAQKLLHGLILGESEFVGATIAPLHEYDGP